MDYRSATRQDILAVPSTEPERLFGRPDEISGRYKILAKRWHPDHVGGDKDVFTHVGALHAEAKRIAAAGMWHVPGEFTFSSDGRTYVVKYKKAFDFELGKAYIGETRLTYVIQKDHADLAAVARTAISGFRFPDDGGKTEKVMRMYLPKVIGYYETPACVVVMIDKPADLVRMRDLVEYHGGKIDATHVAWMVSRMLHHLSYFEWAKIVHNDLSLDTLFVCPEHHTVCVLGGWWYSGTTDGTLKALPGRTIGTVPPDVLKNKEMSFGTDLALVRLTALELLGSANGIHLVSDRTIPPPMLNFLRVASSGSALKDYTNWRVPVLESSFGPRKFVKMNVRASDVYKQEK